MATATKQKAAPKPTKAFSAEEREAMEARAAEMKSARGKGGKPDGEADLLAKIAEMSEPDRKMAERIHAIVKAAAPGLSPKTWYGMPAYARGDKIVCHFQPAAKFKTRYATLGFSDQAKLDDGNVWANAFAIKTLTAADEARIAALVKKAVG
jgi:uncharacterized protein YdhG (YjbR/CyaY superfamily)